MMEDEVVRRRRWLGHAEFLDLLGATHLIPGPNSTEMAIHIGRQRAGLAGLLVAGACFILPATVIVLGAAWAYVRFRSLPEMEGLLYGVKPVVIAVVVQALLALARTAVKGPLLAAIGGATALGALLGLNEIGLLFGAGAAAALVHRVSVAGVSRPIGLLIAPGAAAGALDAGVEGVARAAGAGVEGASGAGVAALAAGAGATTAAGFGLGALFLSFLKIGAVLFGSGYVLLAFLRAELVERLGWLTEAQLLDAVAVGQVTPGPVFTTATFVGYVLAGVPGAIVATVAIFLPAFVFVAASGPLVPRLRRSPTAGAFLDGVNVASLGLIAVVAWQLGRAAVVDIPTFALAVGSAVMLLRHRINSAWLVLAGGAAGIWLG